MFRTLAIGLLPLIPFVGAWLQCSAPIRGGMIAGRDYEASIWLKADRTLDFSALVVHDNSSWFPRVYAETPLAVGHRRTQVTLLSRCQDGREGSSGCCAGPGRQTLDICATTPASTALM
jgi:hypothetical protein